MVETHRVMGKDGLNRSTLGGDWGKASWGEEWGVGSYNGAGYQDGGDLDLCTHKEAHAPDTLRFAPERLPDGDNLGLRLAVLLILGHFVNAAFVCE